MYYTIETVMDKEDFDSMKLKGESNLLKFIKDAPLDWSGGEKRKIILRVEITGKEMPSDIIEFLNNMSSNLEFYNLTKLLPCLLNENVFHSYEIWEEIPRKEKNVGVSLDLFGFKIAGGRSFFEGEKFLVEKGYTYKGYKYPLVKHTVRPKTIDFIDFMQKYWDGRKIINKIMGRDIVIIRCPVNVTIENNFGQVIGWKNGSFVNEIPNAMYVNISNGTVFYLPNNYTYTIYL